MVLLTEKDRMLSLNLEEITNDLSRANIKSALSEPETHPKRIYATCIHFDPHCMMPSPKRASVLSAYSVLHNALTGCVDDLNSFFGKLALTFFCARV